MNHYIQSIRSTFIILMIVGLGFMQSARAAVDSIGVISVVIGEAEIVRANTQFEAKSGAELFRDDLVKTGKASRVQVLLKDQTAVNLGQNAEIRLDEFVYSGAEPKVSLNVAKGTFRFISGKIADQKPDNVKVKTPLAIIGVRGTEYIGRVGTDLPGADVANAGKTDVTLLSGIIVVENDLGQQIISKPGFGVTIEPTGVISEPTRVSEDELDSKLKAVSTNEEDVKQEEESSDSEPSTDQAPATVAEDEGESNGTSTSSTEEEGAKTEDAPAAESQESNNQESSTQEASSAESTNSSEPAATDTAPVDNTAESTENQSSTTEPASISAAEDAAVESATTSNEPVTSSVDTSDNSGSDSYASTDSSFTTSTNEPVANNTSTTTTQPTSTAMTASTYDSSSILVESNDDYSFATEDNTTLQTSVYASNSAEASDSTSYISTSNDSATSNTVETTSTATDLTSTGSTGLDAFGYSNTDSTVALATQVTADNTLQTTESAAVANSNALPSIYGFSSGTDINDRQRTSIYENNTYVGLISATDADVSDPDNLIYNIESGGDGDLFVLNNVRELVFRLPPDYEVTEDQDVDRIYEVNISVTDGMDDDLKTLYVTVENNPIIDSSSSLNPFEGGITSTAESLIDELPSWSDFFVLAGTDTFDFQSIRFVDQCTTTNFCMSDVVFSASYNASSQLVDVSIQGEFSSSYGGVDGIFSATWDNHPISSFSGSSSSNFNDPNASAPPGTATFVSDINRLQAVFGTTSGVVGLDSDDSASIMLTPAAAPNNTEYLVASQFQLAEDLRANTSYPYSAVGRVGVLELQKDQYGAVINDDFVDSSSFLGQSVPANTTPTATSTGSSSW